MNNIGRITVQSLTHWALHSDSLYILQNYISLSVPVSIFLSIYHLSLSLYSVSINPSRAQTYFGVGLIFLSLSFQLSIYFTLFSGSMDPSLPLLSLFPNLAHFYVTDSISHLSIFFLLFSIFSPLSLSLAVSERYYQFHL